MWFRKKKLTPTQLDPIVSSVSLVSVYRKKPVVIHAANLSPWNAHMLAEWCGGKVVKYYGLEDNHVKPLLGALLGVDIPTLEGTMRADERDFIIKGVDGDFYPCKPEIFHKLYYKVTSRGV